MSEPVLLAATYRADEPARDAAPSWRGELDLRYERTPEGTRGHHRHEGPLRVLKGLYPEGPGICHHVLLHPPGGIVGGDELRVHVDVQSHAHAVVTGPGATRFYRSAGPLASQEVHAVVRSHARWEWQPPEAIVYSGARASSLVRVVIEEGASMIGCDVVALGLPTSGLAFAAGSFAQHLEVVGAWIERGLLCAEDHRLLQSPVGLGGHTVLGTAWLAFGPDVDPSCGKAGVEAARSALTEDGGAFEGRGFAAVTGLGSRVVLARVLTHSVTDAWFALRRVRAAWREQAWELDANEPRVWKV